MEEPTPGRDSGPPGFLQLAGHPVRWRLLRELARSDRQVRELTSLTGHPQSLVSYHLGRLRAGAAGIDAAQLGRRPRHLLHRRPGPLRGVAGRGGRSTAPGARAGPAARRPRPGRRRGCCSCAPATAPVPRSPRRSRSGVPAARSQASSAGSHPRPLHPNTVRVLAEHGIDVRGRAAKHLSVFAADAVRLRDHLVRPGPRGLPGVPRPSPSTSTGASPTRPRPVTPTRRATRPSSAMAAELEDPHRLPARRDRATPARSAHQEA